MMLFALNGRRKLAFGSPAPDGETLLAENLKALSAR